VLWYQSSTKLKKITMQACGARKAFGRIPRFLRTSSSFSTMQSKRKRKIKPSVSQETKPRVFIVDENNLTTLRDNLVESLTPKAIVKHLDQFIIGQIDAKKAVAIALRNRWRRTKLDGELKNEVTPSNILMIGPTGSGKTEITRRLAALLDAPLVKVEATKYTEVGIVGASAEECIKDLVEKTVLMEKELARLKVADQIEESVEAILLTRIPGASSLREEWRERLRRGELENIMIDFVVRKPVSAERKKLNQQETKAPKQERKLKAPVCEARELLKESELEKHLDDIDVSKKAINRAQESGIVIIDEIDKIASNSSFSTDFRSGKGEGVQKELLAIIEGTTVQTDHGPFKTDHVLFIGTGCFHASKPSDLLPELQGRLPIRVELDKLSKDDFKSILVSTKNNLIQQHVALFETEGVDVEFRNDAIEEIAEVSWDLNKSLENIGARRLKAVVSKVTEELSFEAPEKQQQRFIVDRELVAKQCEKIRQRADFSKYVL